MKKKLYIKNLSNKQPTKDITLDDIKYKLPKSTSQKKIQVKVSDNIIFSSNNIPIIAGPNGVENRKLIFNVAKFLKKVGVKIIRGHAYKPLTFPYRSKQYKETMDQGMDWMDEVKIFWSKSCNEVTEIRHLDRLTKLQTTSNWFRNMQNLELLRDSFIEKIIILKRHFGASLRDIFAEHILVEIMKN